MAYLKRPVIVSHWLGGKRVPAGTPGAERRSKSAGKWYAYGVPGRPKPVPLCGDKRAAQQMLARLVAGGERAAAGLADPAAAAVPLVPDLADRFAAGELATTDAVGQAVMSGHRPPVVVYDVELDAAGKVRRLLGTADYNREPLDPATHQPANLAYR